MRLRLLGTTLFLLFLLALGIMISLTHGAWHIGGGRVLDTLLYQCGFPVATPPTPVELAIVWNGRLPRAATAVLVGFALALAGTVMQGIFRNPMAGPGVVGISSGAALGAVVAIYLGFATLFPAALPLFAITGAC